MAGVFAGHQRAACRRTDRAAGIKLGEDHAVLGQGVDRRRADVLLSVVADLVDAEVVGHDEDQIRRPVVGLGFGGEAEPEKGQAGQESQECSHNRSAPIRRG